MTTRSAATPMSVLVVEDDEHIAQLLQFMLRREGHEVHMAPDVRVAKAFIESQPAPSLVLMDVMLPFHDGFELVRLLRAQSGWRQVPVLMLTAKTQPSDIAQALDAGASDCIAKPFAPHELLAQVRRLCPAPPGAPAP